MKSTQLSESARSSRRAAVAPGTGTSAPLGATVVEGGANFSVFSRHAVGIDLLLFDRADDARPSRIIPVDAATNRQYHYWHVFVPGLKPEQIYGYRVSGPLDAAMGHAFDSEKV